MTNKPLTNHWNRLANQLKANKLKKSKKSGKSSNLMARLSAIENLLKDRK